MSRMSQKTLYDEIVTQARIHNSSASSVEILESVLDIISKEVLPTVFKNLGLPEFPSWSMLAFEERGRRKRKRGDTPRKLVERRAVIQQVECLKRRMGWDGGNSVTGTPYFPDSDNVEFLPTSDLSSVKKTMPHELNYAEEIKNRFLEPDKPYPNVLLPMEPKQSVVLSEEIQKKIVSEPIIEEAFKRIEVQIRNLVAERKLETNVEMSFRSDPEIPSWKKYVIMIIPPASVDFKARMNIRTLFEIAIRKEMDDLLKKTGEDRERCLNQLDKSLFLHIEL